MSYTQNPEPQAVIAPFDFLQFTVSENIFAGNAMNRRLIYQYGLLLPPSPHGFVTQGLGLSISAGSIGLIAPTVTISKPIEEIQVDGVKMIFQNTPNTEAPREMNTYPEYEGAGACAVAAGLSGKCGTGKIVCVVSGGNIDLAKFAELVTREQVSA